MIFVPKECKGRVYEFQASYNSHWTGTMICQKKNLSKFKTLSPRGIVRKTQAMFFKSSLEHQWHSTEPGEGGGWARNSSPYHHPKPQVQAAFQSWPPERSRHYITAHVIRHTEGNIKCLIYSQSDILFRANRQFGHFLEARSIIKGWDKHRWKYLTLSPRCKLLFFVSDSI